VAELYLVRHGQAAFGSDDYDRLTELGVRQSRWLGEYFAERGMHFDRVFCGTQRRHLETWSALAEGLPAVSRPTTLPGLNEYDFASLIDAHVGPEAARSGTQRNIYELLHDSLNAWAAARLNGHVAESWAEFGMRVDAAVDEVRATLTQRSRTLVISSGGPISRATGLLLALPDSTTIGLNLQLRNSAYVQLYVADDTVQMTSFNSVPHLDRPDRREALTSI